ncbi:UNVERIFIED_CONTAM: hypothetical protein HDU68_011733 [Siphonaria sp. JEL0065]|nr:hypothetical protein HDU68_011733 [Siphonaria sp. JEL0065]
MIYLGLIPFLATFVRAACTARGTCSHAGTDGYVDTSGITYNSASGIFTGNIVTNLCPNYPNSNYTYSGTTYTSMAGAMPTCTTASLNQYAAGVAAPLRGEVGYTIAGQSVFGPLDNGFYAGQICTVTAGTCDTGTDVRAYLCGGHATSYHMHTDFVCHYDRNATGHSALIGFALDGRGIYGYKESSYSYPTDLDWCGGHYGDVPASIVNGVTYPAASNIYHYHTQPQAPFTIGCFGPIASYAACTALYSSTCGSGMSTLTGVASDGSTCSYSYDTDCPCYGAALTFTHNQMCAVSTTVPAAVTFTAWGSVETTSTALSAGAIAGIVIGSIVGLVAIVGVAWFCRSQYLKKKRGVVASTEK